MKEKKDKQKSTLKVTPGVANTSALNPRLEHIIQQKKKPAYSLNYYLDGIRNGHKVVLSSAITLLESTKTSDQHLAEAIIAECLSLANQSIRIGVTGTPGVGKSTFIEAFGNQLLRAEKKLAVLAVDPSSQISGGSILGDKTRMEKLAAHKDVFIRPSPAKSSLGGVARKTRETIILCEAAGYDTILIETVGVGQSEILVHSMVDFFLLLLLPGSGDELQGIKRGIVEMADLVVVNKADGEREKLAQHTKKDYRNALHLFPPKSNKWEVKVLTCSALKRTGIDTIWETVEAYLKLVRSNGSFTENRYNQTKFWLKNTIKEGLITAFYQNESIKNQLLKIEKAVLNNELSPFLGAEMLLKIFKEN